MPDRDDWRSGLDFTHSHFWGLTLGCDVAFLRQANVRRRILRALIERAKGSRSLSATRQVHCYFNSFYHHVAPV